MTLLKCLCEKDSYIFTSTPILERLYFLKTPHIVKKQLQQEASRKLVLARDEK